ncbi:hypothetical protein GGQ74_000906 [Desulfobaculum xiamenense]|uniref:Sulfotransferase family protein n=1 Tax=Desulfobaculum xiamenense TaxID=995050 RepID=A0A846QET0_9BACT|nr:sulfotransferase [Desulfobaculum xiamenense]NJB67266.1 hypothetical protein [Desulfobaculum xiamenense]
MGQERFALVYVASSGRSGSTLLDMLLGAQPGLWSVGEFHLLPFEMKRGKTPCGCGEVVARCPFWSGIAAATGDELAPERIGRFRDAAGYGRVLRLGEVRSILRGAAADQPARRDDMRRYGQDNRAVLAKVREAAQVLRGEDVPWIVDASKDVYRLLWLARSGLFDLRVIHLVKDPRAFVYSKVSRLAGLSRLRCAVRMSARWLVENALISQVCRRDVTEGHSRLVRYEDLASHPVETIAGLLDWLGVPARDVRLDFREGNHGVSGNAMRQGAGGIRLDERWKTALPTFLAVFTRTVTFPLARRYGY